MEDSRTKIQSVTHNAGETRLLIGGSIPYIFTWANESKGIIRRQDVAYNLMHYFVKEIRKNEIKVVEGTRQECLIMDDFETEIKQPTLGRFDNFKVDGKWKIDCSIESKAVISINGKEGFIEVLFNQVYITL